MAAAALLAATADHNLVNCKTFNVGSTDENYQKKSTRNRSKILAVNGIDILSVPLKKGKNDIDDQAKYFLREGIGRRFQQRRHAPDQSQR